MAGAGDKSLFPSACVRTMPTSVGISLPIAPGLFFAAAALLVAYLEQPNHATCALHQQKTASGATVSPNVNRP